MASTLVVVACAAEIITRRTFFGRLAGGGPGPLSGSLFGPPPSSVAPEANLKIAFLGDSGAGAGFRAVLEAVKREGGQAIVHLGDAIYSETPAQFWAVVDEVLGHDFPYFLAQGNHDLSWWPELSAHALEHLKGSGAISDATSLTDPRFSLVWKGVSLVFLGQAPREDDPRYIVERFARDEHIWKICGWHKNQEKLQLGGKQDEMGWGVYESCRQMGALVQTGHEHSYHRTKTLVSTMLQTVDPTCSDPERVCVRPGAVPVFVSGLGGRSVRQQRRCLPGTYPYGCNGEWAFVYTSNQGAKYGALFLAFNEGTDPRRARGYFKTVDGQVVDTFELQAQ